MSNCIIAQSGGPTSVINASVIGLVHANKELQIFDNVYAGINGIQGILNENIINLNDKTEEELNTFRFTPSSGLGSCRYKLKCHNDCTEEYHKLITTLTKLNISSFFYVGGNDSMDTIAKLSKYAKDHNIDINFIGIPKTIDNDLKYTDHTPGFGSAAKFIATTTLETYLDSSVYINNGVFILETMGRDTGWLAAAGALATINGKPVADFILLPEVTFNKEKFINDVRSKFEKQNQVYIVASEGLRDKSSKFVSEIAIEGCHDNFGHSQLGGVGNYLKELIIESGITKRVKSLELGVLQRCAMHCASKTDLDEAYMVGYAALKYANANKTGYMVAIKRNESENYYSSSFLVEADKVANNVKYFPREWINEDGNHINEKGLNYLKPLIQGEHSLSKNEIGLSNFKVFNK